MKSTMTYGDFLKELSRTPRRWRLKRGYLLRLGSQCVLTAVSGHKRSRSWRQAIRRLGLEKTLGEEIALAGDHPGSGIREDLLLACGVLAINENEGQFLLPN